MYNAQDDNICNKKITTIRYFSVKRYMNLFSRCDILVFVFSNDFQLFPNYFEHNRKTKYF